MITSWQQFIVPVVRNLPAVLFNWGIVDWLLQRPTAMAGSVVELGGVDGGAHVD